MPSERWSHHTSIGTPSMYSSTRYGWLPAAHAGIQQARDVRMRQARQHVAFAREALDAAVPEQRQVQELDRDARLIPTVAALGAPDRAHAALADRLAQRVGANRLPRQRRLVRQCEPCIAFEKCIALDCGALAQQGFQVIRERRVGATDLREPLRTRFSLRLRAARPAADSAPATASR